VSLSRCVLVRGVAARYSGRMSSSPRDPLSLRKRIGKKLLVATVGLATLTIAACDDTTTSGNLIAPPDLGPSDMSTPEDLGSDFGLVGNLLPPPDMGEESDAGTDGGTEPADLGSDFGLVGNLLPPPDMGFAPK